MTDHIVGKLFQKLSITYCILLLEVTFCKLLYENIESAEIRRLLAQSCVNMVLPTRNGEDQDAEITKLCFDVLLTVIKTQKADQCVNSAQTILIAIKVLVH